MKKHLIIAVLALCTLVTFASQNNLPPEEENIRNVVSEFMNGIDNKDADLVESVILEDGTFVNSNLKNEVETLTSAELLSNIRSGKLGGWKRNFEISSVERNDNLAVVKVQISNSRFTQVHVLSLVEVEGKWKIASCCANMSKA